VSHFNIYRRPLPEPGWSLIDTSLASSYIDILSPDQAGIYFYSISAVDNGDPPLESARSDSIAVTVGVPPPQNLKVMGDSDLGRQNSSLPEVMKLEQNYPNPFNNFTEIGYALPSNCNVKLEVYDILGRIVAILQDGEQSAGYYSRKWDGMTLDGKQAVSGIYFYKLTANDKILIKEMLLLK
jgi:hypothetical protein